MALTKLRLNCTEIELISCRDRRIECTTRGKIRGNQTVRHLPEFVVCVYVNIRDVNRICKGEPDPDISKWLVRIVGSRQRICDIGAEGIKPRRKLRIRSVNGHTRNVRNQFAATEPLSPVGNVVEIIFL